MKITKKTFLHCIFCGEKCIVSFFTKPIYEFGWDNIFVNVKCDSCGEEYDTFRNCSFWLTSDRLKNPLNKKIFDCVFGKNQEVLSEQHFLRQENFIKKNGLEAFHLVGNKEIPKPKIFWE